MKERACKRCAQRKIRCDKQKPCNHCIRLGVTRTCIAEDLMWQDAPLSNSASTSQSQIIRVKNHKSRRTACDRCVTRKVGCDKKQACGRCERLHVSCRYTKSIDHENQENDHVLLSNSNAIIMATHQQSYLDDESCEQTLDQVKGLLPPFQVIEEICQVIHQGDFIWHWPYIESDRISSILFRLKFEGEQITIAEMAYLFSFLSATSSLLPASHSCRQRNSTFISQKSNLRYKKAALELLERGNRYAFASDASTPLLECWAYHLLWWDSMTKVEYSESIRFCEQSLISASIIDLFGTALDEARRMFATQGNQSTASCNIATVILALDLLFSNSRIRFLLPGCIANTQLESFVNIAMSTIRLCAFLTPAEKALTIIRAEFTIWLNRTDDMMAKLMDNDNHSSAEIIHSSLRHIQWIEGRSKCIVLEFPEFFGFEREVNSSRNQREQFTSPEDITYFQRNFCWRSNALALQCGILRICLGYQSCRDDEFLVKAFAKARSLLLEGVKSWATIIKLGWLHPTLRFSAAPIAEISLSILYQVMQKIGVNDDADLALNHIGQSNQVEKLTCFIWLKDNFKSIYDFLSDVGISCPSSMNLTIAFSSLQVSSTSIIRMELSFLEKYLNALSTEYSRKEQLCLTEEGREENEPQLAIESFPRFIENL